MKYALVIIKADGSIECREMSEKSVDLKVLQSIVDGYIEVVRPAPFGSSAFDRVRMVVDEEGKLKDKPINVLASALYNGYDPIVGDVVLTWFDSRPAPDVYALPFDVAQRLDKWLNVVRDGVLQKFGKLTAD